MRAVLPGDAAAVACVLYALPPTARAAALAEIFRAAERAHAYARATGRTHPSLGNGSLADAVLDRPYRREPSYDEPDYAACMALLFNALASRG